MTDFIFWGSIITADGDCSHEIKRHLLLGRKALTNLDSILKTLLCQQRSTWSKLWFFQFSHLQDVRVGMVQHKESWVLKNWCFWTVVLEKTLESPLDCKEIKPVNLKEINPEYSLEGLMLKLQYFGHLMQRADSLENTLMLGKIEGRRRRGRQRMRWLDGTTDSMDMSLSQAPGVGDGQGSLACCNPCIAESWHNWTELKFYV